MTEASEVDHVEIDQSVEKLEARLLDTFRTVLPFLSDEELRTAVRADLPEWDSLASLSLVTLLEEDFEVTLDDEDVDRCSSFADVRGLLVERTAV